MMWHFWAEILEWFRCHHHHRHHYHPRHIQLTIKNLTRGGGDKSMASTNANLGDVVVVQLDGHGPNNGAVIPEGTKLNLSSNDPTVATVPATVDVPAGGAQTISDIPVTLLGKGSTDISLDAQTPDGTKYAAAATLVVAEVVPGLVSISLQIINKSAAPTA